MEVLLVGYRPVDFVDKTSSRRIKGTTLYFIGRTDVNIMGQEAWREFAPENMELDLAIGAKYEIQYSKGGNISQVKKL